MAAVAIQISASPPYQRFLSAIENPNTRVLYEGVLKMFVEFTGAKTGGDLLEGDNIVIEDKIIQWVATMKGAGIQASTIKARTEVLKLFYEMNRKPLAWKIIARTVGKARALKHRGWRKEEIAKMLSVAKIREQAVVLLLCSTGCRRGALEWQDNKGNSHYLQMKHLKPRDEWKIFELTIYEGEPEEYHTYSTPEARAKLEEYFAFRQRHGEVITENSYVFVQEFNTRNPESLKTPKPASVKALEDSIDRLTLSSGIRKRVPLDENEPDKRAASGKIRHEQKLMHGFRSFFETTLLDAGFPENWVDMLEGHKLVGLRHNYYQPADDTVLVGMVSGDGKRRTVGYAEAMAELIISDEVRSKHEVKKLQTELSEIDSMKIELKRERENLPLVLSYLVEKNPRKQAEMRQDLIRRGFRLPGN